MDLLFLGGHGSGSSPALTWIHEFYSEADILTCNVQPLTDPFSCHVEVRTYGRICLATSFSCAG